MNGGLIKKLSRPNWFLWGMLLLFLPITSFPFFPIPGFSNAVVRPLSLYPLLILVITFVLVYLLKGGELPSTLGPLLFFIVAAVVSTLLVYAGPQFSLRGQTTTSRAIRAFATLAIGISYFFVTLLMLKSPDRITRSIRLLYISFSITAVWGLLQASSILINFPDHGFLNSIQRLISVRDFHKYRVHGFAYEPSWFASQINILILPVLWAGKLTGFRILGKGKVADILEWLLLFVLVFLLGLSYSRGGFVIGLGLLAVGAGIAGIRWMAQIRRKRQADVNPDWKRLLVFGILIVLFVIVAVKVFLPLLARYDYFVLMWDKLFVSRNPLDYILSIGGKPRLAYAEAGFEVFLRYPLFGVGLGQAGFHMMESMPNWVYLDTTEIIKLMSPFSSLYPNPKNLVISLLAETGIVGTGLFILFMLMALVQGLRYFKIQNRFGRFMGIYSILAWLAVVIGSYTLDSFATPNMWIAFGFMYAPAWPGLLEALENAE
ncbi:MAG: O-antigen ligase family protein [Anaerolineales bacterium]|nr:O-antigen ligase family protein [Anaerolineales bacterium]